MQLLFSDKKVTSNVVENAAPLFARVKDMGTLLIENGIPLVGDEGEGTVTSIGRLPDGVGHEVSSIFALINCLGADTTMVITLGASRIALSASIEVTYENGCLLPIIPGDVIGYETDEKITDVMLVLGGVHGLMMDGTIEPKASKILGVRLVSVGRKNQANEIRIAGPTGKALYNFKSENFKLTASAVSGSARKLHVFPIGDYYAPMKLSRSETLARLFGTDLEATIDKALVNAFPMFDCYREQIPACGFFRRLMELAELGRPLIPVETHGAFLLKMAQLGTVRQVEAVYKNLGEVTAGLLVKGAAECMEKGRFYAQLLNSLPYLHLGEDKVTEILAGYVPVPERVARAERGSGNHIDDSRAPSAPPAAAGTAGKKRTDRGPPPALSTRGCDPPAAKKAREADASGQKRKDVADSAEDEAEDEYSEDKGDSDESYDDDDDDEVQEVLPAAKGKAKPKAAAAKPKAAAAKPKAAAADPLSKQLQFDGDGGPAAKRMRGKGAKGIAAAKGNAAAAVRPPTAPTKPSGKAGAAEPPAEPPAEPSVIDPRLLAVEQQLSQLAASQKESSRLQKESLQRGRSQQAYFRPLGDSPALSAAGSTTGSTAPEMNGAFFGALQTLQKDLITRQDDSHKDLDEKRDQLHATEREANAANLKLIGELRTELSELGAKFLVVSEAAAAFKAEALSKGEALVVAKESGKMWCEAAEASRKELKEAHAGFFKHLSDMAAAAAGRGGGGGGGGGGGDDSSQHRRWG
jgi:hypothetical protein